MKTLIAFLFVIYLLGCVENTPQSSSDKEKADELSDNLDDGNDPTKPGLTSNSPSENRPFTIADITASNGNYHLDFKSGVEITFSENTVLSKGHIQAKSIDNPSLASNLETLGYRLDLGESSQTIASIYLQLGSIDDSFEGNDLVMTIDGETLGLAALPSSAIPASSLPSTDLPVAAIPASAIPSNAIPASAIPSNAIPSNALPAAAIPASALPSNAIPASYYFSSDLNNPRSNSKFLTAGAETSLVVDAVLLMKTINNDLFKVRCDFGSDSFKDVAKDGLSIHCPLDGAFPLSSLIISVFASPRSEYDRIRINDEPITLIKTTLDPNTAPNTPPEIANESLYELIAGQDNLLIIEATDPDKDLLLAFVDDLPPFAMQSYHQLLFTPTQDDIGKSFLFSLNVRDNGNPVEETNKKIAVIVVEKNGDWSIYQDSIIDIFAPKRNQPSVDDTIDLLGSNTDTTPLPPPEPEFFGIGEPLARIHGDSQTIADLLAIEGSLGAKRHREWVDFNSFLVDEVTVKEDMIARLNTVIDEAGKNGIEIFAVEDGSYPAWLTGEEAGTGGIFPLPRRSTSSGSTWQSFLDKYEKAWQTLASALPAITHWEIENETNFDLFFYPPGYNPLKPAVGINPFSAEEKIEMYVDMLDRAFKAIKAVNPDNQVILGGILFGDLIGLVDQEDYISMLYDEIKSRQNNDPDDYFDAIAWHPYTNFKPTTVNFVSPQRTIVDLIETNDDGDKPIYVSEIGYSENHIPGIFTPTEQDVAGYCKTVYGLIHDYLPEVETVFWFRLLDQESADPREDKFGLLHSGSFTTPFAEKPVAKTYRELTTGIAEN